MARPDWSRWVGALVTIAIALLAFAMQWGVVMTKLDQVEERLDEFIVEARSLRQEYQDVERRVSYLEGLINAGRSTP